MFFLYYYFELRGEWAESRALALAFFSDVLISLGHYGVRWRKKMMVKACVNAFVSLFAVFCSSVLFLLTLKRFNMFEFNCSYSSISTSLPFSAKSSVHSLTYCLYYYYYHFSFSFEISWGLQNLINPTKPT